MHYGQALLALVCLASAMAIGRARKGYGEGDQPALFCALLGFALAAAAAATGTLGADAGADWQAARLWLDQASTFLALPLLGGAALALGRGWAWSRPNWGRAVLGLCAFFELFRQLGLLEQYRLALESASLLLILYAGAAQWPRRAPVLAALAVAGLFLLGQWRAAGGSPAPLPQAAAHGLLAWLLLSLPGSGGAAENPVKTL